MEILDENIKCSSGALSDHLRLKSAVLDWDNETLPSDTKAGFDMIV